MNPEPPLALHGEHMYEILKRTFDILVSGTALLVVWPVLAGIALCVKLSSPGPVFYRGVRTGRHGEPFRIFKFRSMIVDGERKGGTTTGHNDPRITSIGRILRKYKLDELPQLLNVLFGDMSFVGPRPEVAEYTDAYTPHERRILSVRPGITDLASIEFSDLQEHVGAEDPDATYRKYILPRKNALRLQYVDRRSPVLDAYILFKTLWLVATKPWRRPVHVQTPAESTVETRRAA